jgi:hypothetical protein
VFEPVDIVASLLVELSTPDVMKNQQLALST